MSNSEFLHSSEVRNEIKAVVQSVNTQLSAWEKIQKYKFVKHPITVETGELTPTMKLRRHVIDEKFKQIIDDFYNE
jgi:long-chain acyl-CoA synthetase